MKIPSLTPCNLSHYIICLLFTCVSSINIAQTSNNQLTTLVKFKITNLNSWDDARAIDQLISTQPGILMSRSDFYLGIYFGAFSSAQNISEVDYKTWLNSLGFHLSCYSEANSKKDIVKDSDLKNCNEQVVKANTSLKLVD